MWYQDTLNLFDAMIVGPFDFENAFRVPETAWKTLLKSAGESRINVGAVNRIIPLDKPDYLDKDVKGDESSYLALRWNFLHGTG